jgi:hypothetical protein
LFTSPGEWVACCGLIAALLFVEMLQRQAPVSEWLAHRPWAIRWAAYQAAVIAIVMFGQVGARQFIYFQF